MRAAITDDDDLVVNIIELPDDHEPESETSWQPDSGHTLHLLTVDDTVATGWVLRGGAFVAPPADSPPDDPTTVPPTLEHLQEQIQVLGALLANTQATLDETLDLLFTEVL